jgi:hypothetical protein
MSDSVHFTWRDSDLIRAFRTGVCLHGHTMYSEECLWFLPRYLRPIPAVSQILGHYQRGPQPAVDFSRAYWTPPLSPISALRLEQKQIANLDLRPFVSLTDHDSVEAGMGLQVAAAASETPVSVEWTVPYRRSILHLGIHNLPPLTARSWMRVLAGYTAAPDEKQLGEILSDLASIPDVLIVLNHPFWLEEGIEESEHRVALHHCLRECLEWLHAFELNGTRRWKKNSAVIELTRAHSRPVISGGDRHACEPAACLNLTNARSFAEFVCEVRAGQSRVLFMPHYQEPMTLRLLEASWDVLRPYPEYPGRERWIDRFFYRGEDGVARPLSIVWKDRRPWALKPVMSILPFFTTTTVRQTLRYLLSRRTEPLF